MKQALTFLTLVLLFAECTNNVEPSAGFTVQNNNCKAPCAVSFAGPAQRASSYLWEFGDGQTSTDPNPRHTYPNVGVYEVTLTANRKGGSSTTRQKVKVNLYQKVWDKAFKENEGFMVATADGGLLLAGGQSLAYGPSKNKDDIRLTKLGADGMLQWEKTLGGSLYDGVRSLIATADGGFLVGGISESPASGDKSENTIGLRDLWIVKIGRTGAKQWDKTFGRKGTESDLQTIMATPDNGFLVVGVSSTYVNPFDDPEVESWSIHLSQNGETMGGRIPWYYYTDRSVVAPDGGFLVRGAFGVTKVSADSVEQWTRPFGRSDNIEDYLHSMVATPDGGFLLGGTSASPASDYKSENAKGERDYWVVKLSADGQRQWDKTLGGSHDDDFKTVVATPDGGFLLAGVSSSNTSGDKTEDIRGLLDFWVVKIDAKGKKQWDKTFGGTSRDYLSALIPTSDGGFLLGGTSESPPSGEKSGSSNARDYWVIKLK